MNLHQVPETVTLHRVLWAGRLMSAFVVIALMADGTIQLFAPPQIASVLQETGFAMEATRVVGPIILACAATTCLSPCCSKGMRFFGRTTTRLSIRAATS